MRRNSGRAPEKTQDVFKRSMLYSNAEWSKLVSCLGEKQRLEDTVDSQRRARQEQKELSKKLKDSFVGSQEERRMRLKVKREKAKYEKEVEAMEEEKRRETLNVIQQTRVALKRNNDGWKALDSALRLADTLRERKKQEEFQDRVKTIQKKIDQDWSDKILADAREFEQEKLKEKQEKILKKNDNFERTTQSLKQLQEERDRLRALEIEEEQRAVDKVKQEIKDIEAADQEDKARTKKIIDEMTKESFLLEANKRDKEELEEELDKATFHIIKQTTRQLTDMKSKILQERHQAEAEKRDRIHQNLASILAAVVDDEDERIRKDVESAEQKYKENVRAEAERRQRMAREKNESYQQLLREKEEVARQAEETIKWELLKRCRMSEHDKAKEEQARERDRLKRRIQRTNLDTQMEELKLYAAEARQSDEEAVKRSALLWKLDDEEVMKYGDKVFQDCVDKDRPTLPVVKAIDTYKRNNLMVPPKSKNLSQWQSNVIPKPFERKRQTPVPV